MVSADGEFKILNILSYPSELVLVTQVVVLLLNSLFRNPFLDVLLCFPHQLKALN